MKKKIYMQPATDVQTTDLFAPIATSIIDDERHTAEETDEILDISAREEKFWGTFEW